jgi:uncharacterized membrane protein
MEILMTGLVMWALVHFIPSIGMPLKKAIVNRIGENGYKMVFALLMLAALGLVIYGWRNAVPVFVYEPPGLGRPVAFVLLVIAFILFGASMYPTRIKQFVRHPQLASVIAWSIAHLLLNGDSRSLLLFSWMGVWAALEIMLINRRDGEWIKPASPSWGREARGLVISLIIFVVMIFAHPYLAGVPVH